MLKRPTSRRKSRNEAIALNLVPLLDAMVTLIAFLLFSMSFLAFVSIESPVPVAATDDLERKLDEKPLQLTLSIREATSEIWSPFQHFKPIVLENTPEGEPDLGAIHGALVGLKQKYPRESQIVLVPHAALPYDLLVGVLDAVRLLGPTDEPVYAEDERTGVDREVRRLFPDVIFGNLLGGA